MGREDLTFPEGYEAFKEYGAQNPQYAEVMKDPLFQEQIKTMSENLGIAPSSLIESHLGRIQTEGGPAEVRRNLDSIAQAVESGDSSVPDSVLQAFHWVSFPS